MAESLLKHGDRIFRRLRHAGLTRPAVETLTEELKALHERIDALEEQVRSLSS